ncbi:HEAT repeat domain-containing protein [Acinetobacter sp. CE-15]|uniref:HEAT repeat domain-containing protein n=1 Tax=Acinetobacter sp. CE-15 TaxID=3425693 RepID=UPI003DA3C607
MIVDNDTMLAIFANRYLDTLTTQNLIDLIDDPSPEVRTLIARKLQCRGTSEVFYFAELWSKSVLDYQREIAAFILGQLGCLFDKEKKYPFKLKSKPILMNLIDDKSYEVRAAAIAAIGHLYETLSVDIEKAIISKANDKYEEVRIAIAITLGNSSGDQTVRNIYSQYIQENSEVSEWAEVGLEILEEKLIDSEKSKE